MANPYFLYPNWTQPTVLYTPSITAPDGNWIDLAKLHGDVLSEMARYPGLNTTNTKLFYDLGTTRNIGALAIPFHNAQIGNKARMEIATDAGFTNIVYDSDWQEFFKREFPFGSLPFEHPSWVDGYPTIEQAAGRMPPWVAVLPSIVLGRYVRISLDFTGNTDGVVDIGQIVVSQGIKPKINFNYGVEPPFYADPSQITRTRKGTQFADQQVRYRKSSMQFDWLDGDELYGSFFEMVRDYGVTDPIFFIYDHALDPIKMVKCSFMARLENINPPNHRNVKAYGLRVNVIEAF